MPKDDSELLRQTYNSLTKRGVIDVAYDPDKGGMNVTVNGKPVGDNTALGIMAGMGRFDEILELAETKGAPIAVGARYRSEND